MRLGSEQETCAMEPKLDLTKEYGLVLEGGGAKGAYQIGAWRALKEAGVKIKGVSGTSVGALNGALICMDDLEKAEKLWANISYSQVMDVDDELMGRLFDKSQMTGSSGGRRSRRSSGCWARAAWISRPCAA